MDLDLLLLSCSVLNYEVSSKHTCFVLNQSIVNGGSLGHEDQVLFPIVHHVPKETINEIKESYCFLEAVGLNMSNDACHCCYHCSDSGQIHSIVELPQFIKVDGASSNIYINMGDNSFQSIGLIEISNLEGGLKISISHHTFHGGGYRRHNLGHYSQYYMNF